MISGACHVAKTAVLHDIMNRHSLFFQGNDVAAGMIATARGYQSGHIPFDARTEVPRASNPGSANASHGQVANSDCSS
jgi:hypothetical protein